MNKDFLTVEELNFYINNIFLNEDLLHNVPVLGEVSGCQVVGGHCYFTLKDEKAQVKIAFFNCKGGYIPINGEKVLVKGQVDYYIKNGQISIIAYQIIPYGKGELHLKLEKLKQKLENEGLFRDEFKKDIPLRPHRIGVITSIKGAAVQDFISTVRKKNQIIDISVIDVRVQGENSAGDIVKALINADDYGFDIIVLTRGGGSFEDLFCFNDEEIIRTIFKMKTPIISAVGHETDYTLCDFVADKRAITPTAAAEIIGFDTKLVKNEIIDLIENISENVNDKYSFLIDKISDFANEIKYKSDILYNKQKQGIINIINFVKTNIKHYINIKGTQITVILEKLESLNPLKLLDRGYFRIEENGEMINSISELELGCKVKMIGIDGIATAEIIDKELQK